MRKITKESIGHFYNRKNYKKTNTEVYVGEFTTTLKLYGNTIAILYDDESLDVAMCGWNSRTTRERLNGLFEVHVQKIRDVTLLNGERWDGKLIKVK